MQDINQRKQVLEKRMRNQSTASILSTSIETGTKQLEAWENIINRMKNLMSRPDDQRESLDREQ